MSAIKLTAFSGEQPRIIPRLLPDTAAQAAFDTRLDDGGLTPMRQAVQEAFANAVNDLTIYLHQGEWFSSDKVLNVAPGPVALDRLYITGDGAPKMRIGADVYPLAIAAPATALTATPGGSGSGDVQTRIYVYTWVTSLGEESEPCPASAGIDWQPGQTVTLSGFGATPAGRLVTKQRIYRSQTGSVGTYFYLIAERNASTSDYVDSVAVDAFQEPLPSADWNAPVDGLEGIVAMPNGMMAAFDGRDLYFCEPWRPHAWPQKYMVTMDSDIVGLGAIGTSLVVMTKGQPYMMVGSHPSTMSQTKIEVNLPCINARTIVDLGTVIAYASNDGLVAVLADGSTRIVTQNLFDRDAWEKLSPSTAIGGQHFGRYVLFYDTIDDNAAIQAGAIFIDIGGTPYLIRSSDRVSAAAYDVETSSLYFLKKGTNLIYQLDPSSGARRSMSWKSKPFIQNRPINYGVLLVETEESIDANEQDTLDAIVEAIIAANQVVFATGDLKDDIGGAEINLVPVGGDILEPVPTLLANDIAVGIYADDTLVKIENRSNKPIRLPAGFKARRWEITVGGRARVNQIILATSFADLQAVP